MANVPVTVANDPYAVNRLYTEETRETKTYGDKRIVQITYRNNEPVFLKIARVVGLILLAICTVGQVLWSQNVRSKWTEAFRSFSNQTIYLEAERKYSSDVEEAMRLRTRLAGKKIVIATQPVNGLGDHVCQRNVARIYQDIVGLPKESIALASEADEATAKLLGLHEFTLIENDAEAIRTWNPDYIIFSPVTSPGYVIERQFEKPCLAISEYDHHPYDLSREDLSNIHSYALGLGPDALGVFIDPKMRTFIRSPVSKNPTIRLAFLRELPPHIQRAILQGPFSLEAVANFTRNNKLYSGYAHQAFDSLFPAIESIVSADRLTGYRDNHTFCFAGKKIDPPSIIYRDRYLSEQFKEFERALADRDVGSLRYVSATAERFYEEFHTLPGRGSKTITIVVGDLPYSCKTALNMASEPIKVTTGDQSFSDALPEIPLYEVFSHKEDLISQFHKLLPAELGVREAANFYSPSRSGRISKKFDVPKLTGFLVRIKSEPAFAAAMQTAMHKIADTRDCTPALIQATHRLLDAAPGFIKKEVVHLPGPLPESAALDGTEIPFDKDVFLSYKEIVKLIIGVDGVSKVSVYARDSTFKCTARAGGYLVRRIRK